MKTNVMMGKLQRALPDSAQKYQFTLVLSDRLVKALVLVSICSSEELTAMTVNSSMA